MCILVCKGPRTEKTKSRGKGGHRTSDSKENRYTCMRKQGPGTGRRQQGMS